LLVLLLVGLTTTCATSAYHHQSCEFKPCSIQHYVIKFFSNLRQVDGFLRVLRFPPPVKLTNGCFPVIANIMVMQLWVTCHVPIRNHVYVFMQISLVSGV
jgi:hypothetical protein